MGMLLLSAVLVDLCVVFNMDKVEKMGCEYYKMDSSTLIRDLFGSDGSVCLPIIKSIDICVKRNSSFCIMGYGCFYIEHSIWQPYLLV